MITADKLKFLTTLTPDRLRLNLGASGYKKVKEFTGATFVGITNGGEFCYDVWCNDEQGQQQLGKVCVKFDPAADRFTSSY